MIYNIKEFHSDDDEPIKKKDLTVTPVFVTRQNEDQKVEQNILLPPEKETELSRGRIISRDEKNHETSLNLAFIYTENPKKRKKQENLVEKLKTNRKPEGIIFLIINFYFFVFFFCFFIHIFLFFFF